MFINRGRDAFFAMTCLPPLWREGCSVIRDSSFDGSELNIARCIELLYALIVFLGVSCCWYNVDTEGECREGFWGS